MTQTFSEKVEISTSAPSDANDAQLSIGESDGKLVLVGRTTDFGFVQSHNSDPLALNPLGNAVGVGTANPQSLFHIHGAAPNNANNAQLTITETGGNSLLIGRATDHAFVQSHNGEPLALNPLGNAVGIGVTNPQEALEVNGNILVSGDVRLAGADCAEAFSVSGEEEIEPGSVMVFAREGTLRQSAEAYDRKVAGVISGAGAYRPGLILGQDKDASDERLPIALIGRVFCKVDANHAAIDVGDLLTTSPTPGHAMKATDPARAFGAVLGKALRPLNEGRGLIPVMVALQ